MAGLVPAIDVVDAGAASRSANVAALAERG
jgi:hypothetical protein